ncbi:D-alanyl-D-alanine carboxypeptidase/D-alanyl-D-alanine-endopeptidase [Shewanella insulae]|uniref:D-alanyl-D-alanine carboxypeptidase/D-alanyl-D-alanine endopeptidase n=1 Tax=Shewanella insulae TaxID=2681496 RepID=UPI001EFD72C5|nr:D-alanyl-D-alanine carboxypeptidase/D-alanyl-D-alanine-endopeptidase [Shewanella insulae]MCG9756575.1 D-alanyl-D-alanine carboxypeptidase/D-alanyl-D-alanine-endopeptidase [Shewanella insulae]
MTKKLAYVLATLLVSPLAATAANGEVTVSQDYYDNLLAVIAPPHSQLAVYAQDLTTKEVLYQHNADTLLLPASTQKLLTAVAAQRVLGDEFHFISQFSSKAVHTSGKLNGDLYLSFSGDPTLTTDDLRAMIKALKDSGIHTIRGNLLLVGQDREQTRAPGWVWDDLGICYAAPVSRFIVNQNCVKGQLKPKLASNASRLSFPRYLPIKVSTTAVFDKTQKKPFCELNLARLPDNHYHISGCYPGDKPLNLAIAVDDPELYAKQMLTRMFKSANIQIKGDVAIAHQPPYGLRPLVTHRSAALSELLSTMLLDSDNLIADSLFKAVGAHYYKVPESFNAGAKAVKEILTTEGIDLTHSQIIDGSGLSRYNLISAKQLAQTLSLIAKDDNLNSLKELLPIAGISGTLTYKRGFRRPPLMQKVAAKTGSMQGVDNLAGFLTLEDTHQILFVVMENGQSHKSKKQSLAPFSALFLQSLLDKPKQSTAGTITDQGETTKQVTAK